jgi:hypothetical protein
MHAEISCGEVTMLCSTGALPQLYLQYRSHAQLADELDLSGTGDLSFFEVIRGSGWPILVVA